MVFEAWESQARQEAFTISRLGPALAQWNAPEPTRVECFFVIGRGPN
jgi:hypothetical protein